MQYDNLKSIGKVGMLAVLAFASPLTASPAARSTQHHENVSAAFTTNELVAMAPPPFSEGIFPCSDCHSQDDVVDRTPRPVDAHEDIVFEHDAENRWCLDCHDAQNRDKLHLASGTLIDFTESYRLCGQCHGPKLRDWKAGDHGKRTGNWNGKKEYMLCVSCHNPHSPSIKPITPKPPPIRPGDLRK